MVKGKGSWAIHVIMQRRSENNLNSGSDGNGGEGELDLCDILQQLCGVVAK